MTPFQNGGKQNEINFPQTQQVGIFTEYTRYGPALLEKAEFLCLFSVFDFGRDAMDNDPEATRTH